MVIIIIIILFYYYYYYLFIINFVQIRCLVYFYLHKSQ